MISTRISSCCIFVGGTATVQEDNQLFQVNPGEIAVIGSNQLHAGVDKRALSVLLPDYRQAAV